MSRPIRGLGLAACIGVLSMVLILSAARADPAEIVGLGVLTALSAVLYFLQTRSARG